jgi:hypothetical protein
MSRLTKCQFHKPACCSQISTGIPNRVAAVSSAGRLLVNQETLPTKLHIFLSLTALHSLLCMYYSINFNYFHLFAVVLEQMSSKVTLARTVQPILPQERRTYSCCFRAGRPVRRAVAFSRIDLDSVNAGVGAIGSAPASWHRLQVCL